MADSVSTGTGQKSGRESWRAKLPKVPQPVRVDLPVGPERAFTYWIGASLLLILLGVGLNYVLTGGTWTIPEQGFDTRANPFGETQVQFLTAHPYDLLTATLFVVSTALLGYSLLVGRERWQLDRTLPGLGGALTGIFAYVFAAGFAAHYGALGWLPLVDTLGAALGPLNVGLAVGFVGALAGLLVLDVAPANRRLGPERLSTRRHVVRAAGWILFALHWAATGVNLYVVEGGDWVNLSFAMVSVFALTYFAYQEWISHRLGTDNAALRFAAGAVFLAATVWYAFLRIEPLSQWIIETVAAHTVWVLELFGQSVQMSPDGRTGFLSAITYNDQPAGSVRTVIIILACTAIQSMMIFVAAALAVAKADWGRRAIVMGVTIPLVYVLNLFRNVIIIFMWETRWLERHLGVTGDAAFNIAHNWIGKFGSLIALVLIALFMFRVLPEVVHAVIGLLDLPRRRGPIERHILALRGRTDESLPPVGPAAVVAAPDSAEPA